jgi:hypothetical protein
MNNWHFYDTATGLICSVTIQGDLDLAAVNTPQGHAPIPGRFDRMCQRVDISAIPPDPVDPGIDPETGLPIPEEPWYPPVIDYQPPAPPDDEWQTWAWDTGIKRWVSSPTLAAVKRMKIQELAGAYDADFRGGMNVGFVRVPTDDSAIGDYLLLRQMVAEGDWVNTPIMLTDGSFQLLTQTQMAALWSALKTHRRTLLAKLKDKVTLVRDAATDTEAKVAAITWTSVP